LLLRTYYQQEHVSREIFALQHFPVLHKHIARSRIKKPTQEDAMPEGPVLIKKYGNRRLYDTRQSRYITLEELAGVVRAGASVQVVDARGGQDLTRQVLTQVILEAQDRLALIPVELLHALIRAQGTLQQAPLSAFLAGVARQMSAAGDLWAQQLGVLSSPVAPPPGQAASGGPAELEVLRARMDALLERLDRK
jgi:polyhydroxyalkanoate synthesis repressor PhaR